MSNKFIDSDESTSENSNLDEEWCNVVRNFNRLKGLLDCFKNTNSLDETCLRIIDKESHYYKDVTFLGMETYSDRLLKSLGESVKTLFINNDTSAKSNFNGLVSEDVKKLEIRKQLQAKNDKRNDRKNLLINQVSTHEINDEDRQEKGIFPKKFDDIINHNKWKRESEQRRQNEFLNERRERSRISSICSDSRRLIPMQLRRKGYLMDTDLDRNINEDKTISDDEPKLENEPATMNLLQLKKEEAKVIKEISPMLAKKPLELREMTPVYVKKETKVMEENSSVLAEKPLTDGEIPSVYAKEMSQGPPRRGTGTETEKLNLLEIKKQETTLVEEVIPQDTTEWTTREFLPQEPRSSISSTEKGNSPRKSYLLEAVEAIDKLVESISPLVSEKKSEVENKEVIVGPCENLLSDKPDPEQDSQDGPTITSTKNDSVRYSSPIHIIVNNTDRSRSYTGGIKDFVEPPQSAEHLEQDSGRKCATASISVVPEKDKERAISSGDAKKSINVSIRSSRSTEEIPSHEILDGDKDGQDIPQSKSKASIPFSIEGHSGSVNDLEYNTYEEPHQLDDRKQRINSTIEGEKMRSSRNAESIAVSIRSSIHNNDRKSEQRKSSPVCPAQLGNSISVPVRSKRSTEDTRYPPENIDGNAKLKQDDRQSIFPIKSDYTRKSRDTVSVKEATTTKKSISISVKSRRSTEDTRYRLESMEGNEKGVKETNYHQTDKEITKNISSKEVLDGIKDKLLDPAPSETRLTKISIRTKRPKSTTGYLEQLNITPQKSSNKKTNVNVIRVDNYENLFGFTKSVVFDSETSEMDSEDGVIVVKADQYPLGPYKLLKHATKRSKPRKILVDEVIGEGLTEILSGNEMAENEKSVVSKKHVADSKEVLGEVDALVRIRQTNGDLPSDNSLSIKILEKDRKGSEDKNEDD